MFVTWVLTNEYKCPACGRNHCEMEDDGHHGTSPHVVRLHCLACGERWEEEE